MHVESARQSHVGEGPVIQNTAADNANVVDSVDDTSELTELQQYWELEQGTSHPRFRMCKAGLNIQLRFWRKVFQAPVPIIDCISEGYKLPLLAPPPTYYGKNQSLAHQNAGFVLSAIAELLQNHCVQKIPYKPHICNPCRLYLTMQVN